MNALAELYQELIMDHNARPRNFGPLTDATHRAQGVNPLCGDQIAVEVQMDGTGEMAAVKFVGKGCAISRASASLMTDAVRGLRGRSAEDLHDAFHALVTSQQPPSEAALAALGKLAAFQGVRDFPMRVKCATLAWHTLRAALRGEGQKKTISTEDTGLG